MPSKKASAQGRRNLTNKKVQASLSGASVVSDKSSQQQEQAVKAATDEVVAEDPQPMLRSASHKSLSTDEGSLSSRCSSSPASSEDISKSPVHPESNSPGAQASSRKTLSSMAGHVCMPNAPVWVDNGSKGDKAAWLLVLPKFPTESIASECLARTLKSPKNVMLLGPYVTMKNTFLEESRVDGALRQHQRPRAKSR